MEDGNIHNSNTIQIVDGNVRSNPWRTPRNQEVFAAFQRIYLLPWNFWQNLFNSSQVWNLSSYIHSTEETSQCFKWTPPHAWHILGTDLFYWKHFDFLVLGDYFSKFLIVRKLPSSTSSAVCKEISNIFTEFGKPYIVRSDNGPYYASKEFKELMELFQVQHVTSSPHFPQSNGFAEAMVKIAKKLKDHSTL